MRVCQEDLEEKLKSLGFTPLKSDCGIFISKTASGFTVIDMHMDDGTGICSSKEEELRIKHGIQKFYKIKEKNTTQPFKVLGILVMRDMHQGTLKLSQADYINGLLQWFDMGDCNPVLMPIDKGSHLQDGESA